MSYECYMNVTFRFCFRSPLKSLKLPVFKGFSTDLGSHSFLHISFYPLYSNVSFSIPSDEGVDNIRLRMSNDYLPYPKLQPQQGFQIKYQDFSGASHQTIHIVWDDEFAKGRAKDMVIDM